MKKLGDFLRSAAIEIGLRPGVEQADISALWETMATAEGLSSRSEGLRGTTLIVTADSAPHAQEISLRREKLRRAMNDRLGRVAIREIRVVRRSTPAQPS
ncbi:MAG: DUF721 domain-containing protein [Armatimonadetes bacterium]|nr:DUF721 domain-containing protein [Armatimonadota bacterium]